MAKLEELKVGDKVEFAVNNGSYHSVWEHGEIVELRKYAKVRYKPVHSLKSPVVERWINPYRLVKTEGQR